jgi:AcrR family transcriptional regulator
MARTLNPELHAGRREAFVDGAVRLIQLKGYEQMSIADILSELDASRGAFYHYFDSKADILEAVVERLTEAGMAAIEPMIDDPRMSAPDKLVAVFGGIAAFKAERSDLILAVMRVWQSDSNAIVREKLRTQTLERFAPALAKIVRQGCDEGAFTATSPDRSAGVLISLMQGVNELALRLYFERQAGTIGYDVVVATFAAYMEAFERILGATPGSLRIVSDDTLRRWFG